MERSECPAEPYESGSDSYCGVPGYRGNNLLHYAAQNGNVDVIAYLIDSGGSDVNARNLLGETPLHCAAASYGDGQ